MFGENNDKDKQGKISKVVIELSWWSVVKVIAILGLCYLLIYLFDVILVLFIVIVLAAALSPFVDKIKDRLHIPRIMAILLIYLGLLGVVAFAIYGIVPPVAEQLQNLAKNMPAIMQQMFSAFESMSNDPGSTSSTLQSASSALNNVANTFVKSASSLFGGVSTAFYILVLTLFLLLEEDGIRKFFVSLLPISQKAYVIEVSKKLSDKLGKWLVGQVTLMVIIGFVMTIVLWIIGVPYTLTLGLIAGLLEIIPTLGPIIAAVPAVFIAFLDTPWKALAVIIAAVVIQQLENQLLIPKIMKKVVGVSPFVALVALLIGGKLAGVLGMVMAVPVVAAMSVLSKEWPNIKKRL